jgi:dipeptidyl aminopeptidase/acylaminoacyl peptidase
MRRTAFAALGLILSATLAAAAPAPQPLSAEAMWGLKRVGAPAISPDGRNVAVAVARFDVAKNKRLADLYLVPTSGAAPRALTNDDVAEGDPQWSPDGASIAFVARRPGDEAGQLYVLPIAAPGEARRLTDLPAGVSDFKWLPDSSGFAFTTIVFAELTSWEEQAKRRKERADSKMTARVWTRSPISRWDQWTDDTQAHIYTISLAPGAAPKPVTLGAGLSVAMGGFGPAEFDISPDGEEIAFVANIDASGIDPNTDVFTIPIGGGEAKNRSAPNPVYDGEPAYSPDGRRLAFIQQRIRGFYADKRRVMVIDRSSGATSELATTWDRSADGLVWAGDSRSLFGAIDDAGTTRVYRFGLNGAAPTPITAANDFTSLDLSDGRNPVLVGLRQSFSSPPALVRIDSRSGAATALHDFNAEGLANTTMGKVESVTYKGANGKDIQMWVTYPPGFDPNKKYPLFLLLHGGPHNGITDAWTWRWNSQVFAGWGYVVAWHNFHGSSGFGQEFTDSINPNWADLPYEDTIKAAEWFKSRPWIDSTRMIAGGGSYGGYLASVLLGRDHPFNALIAHAAVYNSYTQTAADSWANKARHFEFWENPAEFQRFSPHMAAGNFKTPTLVIHGQLDYRVPVNHGIELFQTLQKRGVPSKFVYYPNENHWILQPQNSLFWYRTVREWVESYAKPGPTPAPTARVAAGAP